MCFVFKLYSSHAFLNYLELPQILKFLNRFEEARTDQFIIYVTATQTERQDMLFL